MNRRRRPGLALSLAALVLGACASGLAPPEAQNFGDPTQEWQPISIPGKQPTKYRWVTDDGKPVIEAYAERSASMWRKRLQVPSHRVGETAFSWRIERPIAGASVAEAEREDAPARVLFAFSGDIRRLPHRTRLMFDLAEALTGEVPPYATLMYVWDSAPEGSLIHNPRSDRIRKIVLDSGVARAGQWRHHRRNLREDFIRAFGEEPGDLVAVAVMTDADNTKSLARAWYGPIKVGP